jgi:hypothetical protein
MALKGMHRRIAAMVVVSLALGLCVRARADASGDALERSNALFAEGKRQLEAGEVSAACNTFAESHRLVPRGGTLLNLALCREQEGKLVEAFRTLHEALAMARRDARDDRVALALEHIVIVEARLSWVALQLPDDVEPMGLTVRVDQSPVVRKEWNAIPVQAGEHELTVEGEELEVWRTRFTVDSVPKRLVVVVPQLSRSQGPDRASSEATIPAVTPVQPEVEGKSARRIRRLRYSMYGIGLAGIVVGAVTGGLAIQQRNTVRGHCDEDKLCDATGKRAAERGGWMIHVSTVGYAVGAVGLSTWLFFPGGWFYPGKREVSLTLLRRF